jgi:long-chain acyl-CoA synthetase
MILYDLAATSAATAPDAPALCFRDTTFTYGELLTLIEGFAHGVTSLRLHRPARIAVLLPNCPQFIIAYLGAGRAGASVVPINVLYRPDEVRYILADSEIELLITAEPFRPLVEALRPHVPALKHVVMVTENPVTADEIDFRALCGRLAGPLHPHTRESVAVILYTSGTTGRPKGAMLTHRNLLANAQSCADALPVSPTDCFLSALPLFHAFAAMAFLVLPVSLGARIQLMERFLPAHTLQLMSDSGATIFGGVPSMFSLMLQLADQTHPDLSKLRLCVSGGAPLPPEVWIAFEEAYDAKMIEGYGLTEAAPVVTVNPPYGLRKPGSVGLPVPGVQVKIVDDQGRPVVGEAIGELLVRGENVMTGYLNRPQETKEIIQHGWLHTGDLTRQDADGYLFIVGRKKELILVGGLNVYPGEVERVLLEHPAVVEAAAFGVTDPTRGEAVWAGVVLRAGETIAERALQAFCRERLASYKVPRGIELREELPKNALGKVQRHRLHEEVMARFQQPTPVKSEG